VAATLVAATIVVSARSSAAADGAQGFWAAAPPVTQAAEAASSAVQRVAMASPSIRTVASILAIALSFGYGEERELRMKGLRCLLGLACAGGYPALVLGHHSTAEYDSTTIVEAQGDVTKVLWANPHIRIEISTQRFDGVGELWYLEGQNPTDLDRANVPRDIVKVGDEVKFAGNASTRRERHMYVTNVLLPNQTELVLRANAAPRWAPERYVSHRQATIDPARAAADRPEGIFRVWLPVAAATPSWASDPPLTDAARAAWKAYDAVRDDPVIDCRPPGMPQVITRSGRYAIRFVRMGDDIVLKNEYRELDRLIHMMPEPTPTPRSPTPLGYSTGKWEGASLVVTTTDIDWPYFQLYGLEGVPQSRQMRLVERFTPSADGTELKYDIAATDPATFTQTVTADGYRTFRWQPGFEFLPQDCVLDAASRD
jgi:hypothetical protein